MRIATASGLNINTGLTAPITRVLRETLNRLAGKDLYIVPPFETYWVKTLSNPQKPNIWAGKGPRFDSDGDYYSSPTSYWRVLENGYMTNYKNDNDWGAEMFNNNSVDTQTFEGSRERISFSVPEDAVRYYRDCHGGSRHNSGRKSKKHIKFLRRAVM